LAQVAKRQTQRPIFSLQPVVFVMEPTLAVSTADSMPTQRTIVFHIDDQAFQARVVDMRPSSDDLVHGFTHKLQYLSGSTGTEWVHLDESNHILRDGWGHASVKYHEIFEEDFTQRQNIRPFVDALVLAHCEHIGISPELLTLLRAELVNKRQGPDGFETALSRMICFASHGDLRVSTRLVSGKAMNLGLKIWTTVGELKTHVSEALGVPRSQQRLLLDTVELKDPSRTLAECGVTPTSSTITVVCVGEPSCKIIVGAERLDAEFPTASTIRGRRNVNLDHIADRFACLVQLRGLSSGTLEGETRLELSEPLFIGISGERKDVAMATAAAMDLLHVTYEHHRHWCGLHRRVHPTGLAPVVICDPGEPATKQALGAVPVQILRRLISRGEVRLWRCRQRGSHRRGPY